MKKPWPILTYYVVIYITSQEVSGSILPRITCYPKVTAEFRQHTKTDHERSIRNINPLTIYDVPSHMRHHTDFKTENRRYESLEPISNWEYLAPYHWYSSITLESILKILSS